MKKVKCIDSNNGKLTIGKLYEISPQWRVRTVRSNSSFYIQGDDNVYRYYDKNLFIDIQEDRENKLKDIGI
jgi:hypothetical protein